MNNLIAYLIFIAILLSWAVSARTQDFDPVYDISDVMSDLLKTAPSRPLYRSIKKRTAFARDLISAANKHKVPELLLTVKIFNESSFRFDVWDEQRMTYGLGQMHGAASNGCDMSTRKGQLDCSARWLRVCYDKCGTWAKALAAYGTSGHCDWRKAKHPKKYRHAVNRQIRVWTMYEQQRDIIRAEIIDDLEHIAAMREHE